MAQTKYHEILAKIQDLQTQLEEEFNLLLAEKRAKFKYRFKKGKVFFDKDVHEFHQKHRIGVWSYLKEANLLHVLTSPFIYSVIIPLLFLDLVVFIYQQICFRVYGIPIVSRSDYIIIDRQHLVFWSTPTGHFS